MCCTRIVPLSQLLHREDVMTFLFVLMLAVAIKERHLVLNNKLSKTAAVASTYNEDNEVSFRE